MTVTVTAAGAVTVTGTLIVTATVLTVVSEVITGAVTETVAVVVGMTLTRGRQQEVMSVPQRTAPHLRRQGVCSRRSPLAGRRRSHHQLGYLPCDASFAGWTLLLFVVTVGIVDAVDAVDCRIRYPSTPPSASASTPPPAPTLCDLVARDLLVSTRLPIHA